MIKQFEKSEILHGFKETDSGNWKMIKNGVLKKKGVINQFNVI